MRIEIRKEGGKKGEEVYQIGPRSSERYLSIKDGMHLLVLAYLYAIAIGFRQSTGDWLQPAQL